MTLPEAERARWAGTLPILGGAAQQLVRQARVHVVGAGAAGGPALLYLAQAGVDALYVDDGADVAAEDAGAWLYPAAELGRPRLLTALGAVAEASAFVRVRPYATGVDATAVLVCAASDGVARTAAERARLAGLPHVIARADGEGGEVVTVPRGAPCLGCASRPGSSERPRAGVAAAVGALGALELLLLLAGARPGGGGRRITLVRGVTTVEPTARAAGCDCANAY